MCILTWNNHIYVYNVHTVLKQCVKVLKYFTASSGLHDHAEVSHLNDLLDCLSRVLRLLVSFLYVCSVFTRVKHIVLGGASLKCML